MARELEATVAINDDRFETVSFWYLCPNCATVLISMTKDLLRHLPNHEPMPELKHEHCGAMMRILSGSLVNG